ncbi:phosphoribosylamine--glycine ligase [Candidatus Roizmanbacteria bacterium RIFCSPLOWO2_02_FULL_38_10]|uniref:Phosphoribosylamine--glycine ligase n=1 Tax=Candidatus Roizmanbacteria bacterium RIFCSPLOWO2_02_FULL_38_10 TaxID=1802074 RepID=A0A1F7JP04_9BACT|nr:MAG: phosphoribosylamine--glycine ligase [Candidatus Roizmanbacteria bacterium RIFCSPLOWO2_02_FULL_38_10]
MKKAVLIIGSGGREHAIGWKFNKSPHIGKIYFAPGNGGTELLGENVDINVDDLQGLVSFVKDKQINLTFVGPEAPLVAGIVDVFKKNKLAIFGPTKQGALLEGDKAFACEFLEKYSIPHPKSKTFNDPQQAKNYVGEIGYKNCVIKASGLASGKGVIIPKSQTEADESIDQIMVEKIFGDAGTSLIIQERLNGPEVSIIAFTDGKTIIPLPPSQDHKRIFDNDQGPNTGGMGAYAPVPFITEKDLNLIQANILEPTLSGLKKEKIDYQGVIYAGLMMTSVGPKVLEYNVRFGDPETQPLMMLLQSDLYELSLACISGALSKDLVKTKPGFSVCIVIAANGYPGTYQKGTEIYGLDLVKNDNPYVFHAGTAKKNTKTLTSGGRVLGVTAYGNTVKIARDSAYAFIGQNGIHFEGMHYRKDIGWQALNTYDKPN